MRTYNVNHTTHKKFTYIVVCLGETIRCGTSGYSKLPVQNSMILVHWTT